MWSIERFSMSEIIEIAKLLGRWPVVEGFFIIVITFLGIVTYRRGDRDRRQFGSAAVEIPLFLLSGPLADAITSVHNISEQQRAMNDLLRQMVEELRRQNAMMEWIGNQAGLVPPVKRTR